MRFQIKRRRVVTETVEIEVADLLSGPLDAQVGLTKPEVLDTLPWTEDADEENSATYAVRAEDWDTARATFEHLAEEFSPGQWRIKVRDAEPGGLGFRPRPAHFAVVLVENGRWLSATQDEGDGNNQVNDHERHDDFDDAAARCAQLYLECTQPL